MNFFILNNNNIKSSKFKKKVNIIVPVTIVGNNDANDYKITVPINYKNLEAGKNYNIDYHLFIEYSENI